MAVLINVLGAERTGSTLLDVMLGHGESSFSCGEISFFFRPMRRHDFILDCSCGKKNCAVWKEFGLLNEGEFHNHLLEKFDHVIDSSKNLVWVIDSINNLKPGTEYINLVTWKSTKKILYSHWKRGVNLEKVYSKYLTYYEHLLETGLNFYSINHEDLIKRPKEVLIAISKITGLEYFESKEMFWKEENHHFLFGSHGIRQQVKHRKSEIYTERINQDYIIFYDKYGPEFENSPRAKYVFTELKKKTIFGDYSCIYKGQIKKPLWYYLKKYGRLLLRYFPRNYEIKDVNPIYGKEFK